MEKLMLSDELIKKTERSKWIANLRVGHDYIQEEIDAIISTEENGTFIPKLKHYILDVLTTETPGRRRFISYPKVQTVNDGMETRASRDKRILERYKLGTIGIWEETVEF
jgi:hypothetical protein